MGENYESPKRHNLKTLSTVKRTNTMNPLFGSKSLWAKFWLISTLCFVLCLANPILEEDSEDSDALGDEEINAVNLYDYLQRLAASRNNLYENPYMVSDMLRDRRRGSMAENNFQLRV